MSLAWCYTPESHAHLNGDSPSFVKGMLLRLFLIWLCPGFLRVNVWHNRSFIKPSPKASQSYGLPFLWCQALLELGHASMPGWHARRCWSWVRTFLLLAVTAWSGRMRNRACSSALSCPPARCCVWCAPALDRAALLLLACLVIFNQQKGQAISYLIQVTTLDLALGSTKHADQKCLLSCGCRSLCSKQSPWPRMSPSSCLVE